MEATSPQRPQLLSVDDEPNILKSIKRTLRRCDVDVTIANSGKEALEILAGKQFDVIISDMRMPEMTGAEFLAEAYKRQPDSKRILLTGYSDIQSTADAINHGGVSSYLTKPWDDDQLVQVVEEAVKLRNLVAKNESLEEITRLQNEELKTLNAGLEQKVEERTQEIAQASEKLEQAVTDLTDSYDTMVSLLSSTAGLRDETSRKYNEQKLELALAITALANLDEKESGPIKQATELHRIGLLSLPDVILQKPYKLLSEDQRDQFNEHPVYAEAILMGVPELNQAATLIRHQYENWDGSGYPDGMKEDAIPKGSRILSLARDYFDLIGGQFDSKQYPPEEALDHIESLSGTKYDPQLVPLFLQVAKKLGAEKDEADTIVLDVARLKSGMVLAKDLKSEEGMMLLRKGQKLTDPLIRKIANLRRTADASLQVSIKND